MTRAEVINESLQRINSDMMRDISRIAAGVAAAAGPAGPGVVAEQAIRIYAQLIHRLSEEAGEQP